MDPILLLWGIGILLVGLAPVLLVAGYMAIKRPTKYRVLISAGFAIGAALLLLGACSIFGYTLQMLLAGDA